jgi:hypothetical protein
MKIVTIIYELRHRPFKLAAAALLSVVIGLMVAFHISASFPPKLTPRRHDVGVAVARILVNTPSSIVADLNPNGGNNLSTHAQLLGDLIASDAIRTSIAQAAGISPNDLAILPPSVGGVVQTELATDVRAPIGAATLSVNADDALPIVSIKAQAATPALAAKLANDSVTALQNYIGSVAKAQNIPTSNTPVITALGPAQGVVSAEGVAPEFGIVAAIVCFLLFCYGILVLAGLRRMMREARDPQLVAAALEDYGPYPPAEALAEIERLPARTLASRSSAGERPASATASTRRLSATSTQTQTPRQPDQGSSRPGRPARIKRIGPGSREVPRIDSANKQGPLSA